jgi:uncharacterized membrane protein
MNEIINIALNTIIYPLLGTALLLALVELSIMFYRKDFKLHIPHRKKGFYIAVFGSIIMWGLIILICSI